MAVVDCGGDGWEDWWLLELMVVGGMESWKGLIYSQTGIWFYSQRPHIFGSVPLWFHLMTWHFWHQAGVPKVST